MGAAAGVSRSGVVEVELEGSDDGAVVTNVIADEFGASEAFVVASVSTVAVGAGESRGAGATGLKVEVGEGVEAGLRIIWAFETGARSPKTISKAVNFKVAFALKALIADAIQPYRFALPEYEGASCLGRA